MARIGIECHNLEQPRAGVARSISEMLRVVALNPDRCKDREFHLYFKGIVPPDPYLHSPCFIKRILPSPTIRPSFTIFYNYSLPRALKKDGIDIALFPSYMVPFGLNTPSVVIIYDVSYEAHPEWFHPIKRRYQYRILSRHGAHVSKKIITISEFSKREIMRYYHIPESKIAVIPLGISSQFNERRDISRENEIRRKYGLGDTFILWVGQMLARRHVPEAIEGFKRIAPRHANLQFFISGQNLIYPPLDIDQRIRDANAALGRNAIVRVPYVNDDELPHLYRASQLLVWMTSYEGMGLPLLEALACGTPILTLPFEASKEFFGEAAFFVKNPLDSEEVSSTLERALTDERERSRIRNLGSMLAKKFSWERFADGVLGILKM